MQKSKIKKIAIGLLVGVFLLLQIFAHVLIPKPASAITGAPDVVAYMTQKDVKVSFWNALYSSALQTLVRAATNYARDLAYNSAVYVASGGKGKSPLAFQDSFQDYLRQSAGDEFARSVEAFGKQFGLNLCGIPDASLLINLKIGLRNAYGDAKKGDAASCNWQKLKDGWSAEAFEQRYGPGGSRFMDEVFTANIKVEESDFGVALDGLAAIDENRLTVRETKTLDRLEGQGFKSVKSLISGKTLTPAQTVKEESKTSTSKHEGDWTTSQITGLYAADAWQIFPMAASVFLNTLADQMLQKIFKKGLLPDPGLKGLGYENDSRSIDNREIAQRELSFLKVSNPIPVTNFDILNQFKTCPDTPGLNNCVLDDKLSELLTESRTNGKRLTIEQAMKSDDGGPYLDPNKPLISPVNEAIHNSRECYKSGYCYSNIQKLRRQRILPIGFEVAALRADPDNPPTLREVVDGFDVCPYIKNDDGSFALDEFGEKIINATDLSDVEYRWCHLINPNWIVRAPLDKCEYAGYGPFLISDDLSIRNEECLDISTCIVEDDDGNCIQDSAYGYCLQEENVWNIGGDSCPWYYNTCKTFVNNANNRVVSYLSRTVDYGTCNEDSVGCLAYSTEKDTNGTWVNSFEAQENDSLEYKLAGRNQVLYLNNQVNQHLCTSDANGCSAFYTNPEASNQTRIFYKKAPAYLNCYDRDPTTPEEEWPETLAQVINNISHDVQCNNFAHACVQEEVGCDGFTPLNRSGRVIGPEVPGIIGSNSCSSECVGYDTFRQKETQFESSKFPLHFIPSDAQTCRESQVGCDEFTSLSNAAGGGENTVYLQQIQLCVLPKDDLSNEKTFYTWEGSVDEGLRLQTHRLLVVNQVGNDYLHRLAQNNRLNGIDEAGVEQLFPVGSPAYNDDSADVLNGYLERCNEETYNNRINGSPNGVHAEVDCKKFFDDDQHEFYRLLQNTVLINASCQSFRKTGAELYIDPNLDDEDSCSMRGGYFAPPTESQVEELGQEVDGPVCQRCRGGGEYVNGVCVYQAVLDGIHAKSCSEQAAGCREYVGNSGNNAPLPVIKNDFEPENAADENALALAKAGWSPEGSTRISAEAVDVGFHSLRVDTNMLVRTLPAGSFSDQVDINYELQFWARGSVQTLNIYLKQEDQQVGRFTYDVDRNADVGVSISDSWQLHKLGPVHFSGDINRETSLIFERAGGQGGTYFIDNVQIASLTGRSFLIKDSWRRAVVLDDGRTVGSDVPLSCDENPEDGLPGVALGCINYKSQVTGSEVSAVGFDKLCRTEAIGCIPVYDTHNTINEGGDDTEIGAELAQVYHALCVQGRGQIATDKCSVNIEGATYECNGITKDSDRCYIKEAVLIPEGYDLTSTDINGTPVFKIAPHADDAGDAGGGGPGGFPLPGVGGALNNLLSHLYIDSSSVYTQADTPADAPIYLAAHPDYQCNSSQLGCTEVAQQEQVLPEDADDASYNFRQTFFLANPSNYSEILCANSQLGCEKFSNTRGDQFFKDPEKVGNRLCKYVEAPSDGSLPGWYLDGIGGCSGTDGLCSEDADCRDADGQQVGSCNIEELIPCYQNPAYIRHDTPDGDEIYGIYSNETPQYQGFVGVCQPVFNMCTELVDRKDRSTRLPLGKPYYVIQNEKIDDKQAECANKVSETEGCILFNKTENPNKLYNTADTYAQSKLQNFALVSPSTTGTLDSNLILKVERDRRCSEWLDCKSQVKVQGETEPLCYELGVCSATDGFQCTNWVTDESADSSYAGLNYNNYIQRDVSFKGNEFTGYSLYNKRQIADMRYYITVPGVTDTFIAYKLKDSFFLGNPNAEVGDQGFSGRSCKKPDGSKDQDWIRCGPYPEGRCYSGDCIYPVSGDFPGQLAVPRSTPPDVAAREQAQLENYLLALGTPETEIPALVGNSADWVPQRILTSLGSNSCKSFPEQDSPFPQYAAEDIQERVDPNGEIAQTRREFIRNVDGYSNVNVCQYGDCSCEYNKVTYGDDLQADFWPLSFQNPGGKCIGNEKAGQPCHVDADCKVYTEKDPRFGEDVTAKQLAAASQGTCQLMSKRETWIGLQGYCLERDYSRGITLDSGKYVYPCLTWLPVDVSASVNDRHNTNVQAGYDPNTDAAVNGKRVGGEVYCLEGTKAGVGIYDQDYFIQSYTYYGSFYSSEFRMLGPETDQKEIHARGEQENCIEWEEPGFCEAWSGQNVCVLWIATPHCHRRAPTGECIEKCTDGDFSRCTATEAPVCRVERQGNIPPATLNMSDTTFNSPTLGSERIVPEDDENFNTPTLLSAYRSLFNDNGKPHLFSDGGVCNGARYYSAAACRANPKPLYTSLQLWSWYNIGRNAVVLRTAHGLGYDFDNRREDGIVLGADHFGVIKSVRDRVRSIYALAPDSTGHYTEYGTIMHPPRHWLVGVEAPFFTMNQALISKNDAPEDNESVLEDPQWKVRTNYYSPEKDSDQFLYIAPFEKELNEKLLAKVYFVPQSLPNRTRIEGTHPPIFSKDLFIDIIGLQQKRSHAEVSVVGDASGSGPLPPNTVYGNKVNYWWTYMLQADSQGGIVSFDNYFVNGGEGNQFDMFDERNVVHRRYVGVFSDSEKNINNVPDFVKKGILGTVGTATEYADPFTASCETINQNWWAVGMDFNRDGEFLGYITRYCNGARGQYGINLGVVAEVADQCSIFGQVYDDTQNIISGTTNKAWTDRVWKSNQKEHPFIPDLMQSQASPPFGSLPVDASDIRYVEDLVSKQTNIPQGANPVNYFSPLQRTIFRYADLDGIPLRCSQGWFGMGSVGAGFPGIPPIVGQGADPTVNVNVGLNHRLNHNCAGLIAEQNNLFRYSTSLAYFLSQDVEPVDLRRVRVKEYKVTAALFAKIFTTSTKDYVSGKWSVNSTGLDYTGVRADQNNEIVPVFSGDRHERLVTPPQIYSLNPATCFNFVSGESHCGPGEKGNITIGTRNASDQDYDSDTLIPDASEDSDGDQIVDPLIFQGDYVAKAKFFAFADNNAMPLRRVMVDWRDGASVTNEGREGLYKNHKPLCSDSNFEGRVGYCEGVQGYRKELQLLCSADSDCPIVSPYVVRVDRAGNVTQTFDTRRCIPSQDDQHFGDSNRACQEGYFEFIHSYTCSQSDVTASAKPYWVKQVRRKNNPNDEDGFSEVELRELAEFNVNIGNYVCVFKPRVQALDNWGWCNGSCSVEPFGEYIEIDPDTNDNLVTAHGYEGCYNDEMVGVEKNSICDVKFDSSDNLKKPYTEFQGRIIVTPKR